VNLLKLNIKMNIRFKKLLFVFSGVFFFLACSSDSDYYDVGENFYKTDATIGYTDQLTVNASTVSLDSMITSDKNVLFFGYNKDSVLGSLSTETYIPLIFDNTISFNSDYRFDSIVIYFKPTGAYSGDTLSEKTIDFYHVTENIEPDEENNLSDYKLYNNNSFAYESLPLGSVTFLPRPGHKTLVRARLADSLGQLLFDKMMNEDRDLSSDELFLEYFKGIVAIPRTKDKSWSMTFKTSNSTNTESGDEEDDITQFEIRIYYDVPSSTDDNYVRLVLPSDSYLFTHFITNRSNTIISNIQGGESTLSSINCGNRAFIQSGGGLVLKLDFPDLRNILSYGNNVSVLDAYLVIRPIKHSYNDQEYALPNKLYSVLTDGSNLFLSELNDIEGNVASASLKYEDADNQNPYYRFSAINFVKYKLAQYDDNDKGSYSMLITLSETENATTFNRMIVGDQSLGDIELQLYYLTY
jgi:hypothetical protein